MASINTMEVQSLASLLHEAADRHASFEAIAPPHDWWDWYAAYMSARQSGSSPDEAAEAAARYMAASSAASGEMSAKPLSMRLEAVVIPVSDVDRAKQFYARLGWRLDADFSFDNGFRIVQLTPPGSPASIQFGTNVTSAVAGSAQNTYLVVSDIEAARDELVALGVEVSGPFHAENPGAQFDVGITTGTVAGLAPDRASYGSYAAFSDPDGNRWLLQEITVRLPGRVDDDS